VEVGAAAQERFKELFGRNWQDEVDAGRIVPMPWLLERSDLDERQLYTHWLELFDEGKTVKLQDGFIMGFIEELGVYAINGFYPSLEAIFYHPETVLHYHVIEFDSSDISWREFRHNVLGTTNAAKAEAGSFRGKLYREFPVEFPGRDNFVHGSAGPFEGFVERTIHEEDFEMTTSPVGAYLAAHSATLHSFARWKKYQSISSLGTLFDETEEKNTDEIIQRLDAVVAEISE
jgi:hypothetical protein